VECRYAAEKNHRQREQTGVLASHHQLRPQFVREQIDKIRRGRHGARSTRQAIAIALSEARRAGNRSAAAVKRHLAFGFQWRV
jgi:hypothetical protein